MTHQGRPVVTNFDIDRHYTVDWAAASAALSTQPLFLFQHIDMDAFYASVEEQDRPELKGTPLIVGGTGGRGVVAAASYAVRSYGVHSAMPMREALRRCPQAIVVHPRMARYKEVSDQVFAILREFTPLVEGLSLDEAFLDVTASQQLLGGPDEIGAVIRRRINRETGLTASVGIAGNKLLAKIASDLNKPGRHVLNQCRQYPRDLGSAAHSQVVRGGSKTLPTVLAAGIRTFGDARLASDEILWRAFGKHGKAMRVRARGSMIGPWNRTARRNPSARKKPSMRTCAHRRR